MASITRCLCSALGYIRLPVVYLGEPAAASVLDATLAGYAKIRNVIRGSATDTASTGLAGSRPCANAILTRDLLNSTAPQCRPAMHLLLIEDNADLAANIGEYLKERGHIVDYAADGLTGLHLTAVNAYDVLVLDLNLPGLDGVSLCKRLREDARNPVPVLMLTARETERDKLSGFEAGADDYLTKPFSLPELHARLKALARRAAGVTEILRVADLEFDLRTLVVRRDGRRLELTPSGLKLLERLMRVSPGVVSRREVERTLWGEDPPDSEAALRGHVHGLRVVIDQGFSPKLLHTVHGIGYRLADDNEL